MADYLHGAYGEIRAVGNRVADNARSAIVYVGTAPVHRLPDSAKYINTPILVHNVAEAQKYLGYEASDVDDMETYTLAEAIHVHLEVKGVGPIILINAFDPSVHKTPTQTTVQRTPANGKIVIGNAKNIYTDSVEVWTTVDTPVKKKLDKDYTIDYDFAKNWITITEIGDHLGTDALDVKYNSVIPTVAASEIVGETDDAGGNTGLYAMKDVYQKTGYIPAYLGAPGWSSDTTVHAAMYLNSVKINTHWDAYMFVDLPLVNSTSPLTFDTIAAYKTANSFTHENETVFWPVAKGSDGRTYHLSVLAAANFQELLIAQDGIPYKTASNTDCALITGIKLASLVFDEDKRVYDDSLINEKLNKHGIASAVYLGGRWVIWGCHSADYDTNNKTTINVSETNRMMLYYISNDFQHRRAADVDKPMTGNDLKTITSEEQTRLDALVNIGALIYGTVSLDASAQARSDIMNGDFAFMFDITTTPLAKSLTAIVNWTDAGFVTYYESIGV